MSQHRPERPQLVTVIFIFEVVAAFLATLAHIPRRFLPISNVSGNAVYHISALHLAIVACGYALGLAGAVALWQMHRSAFALFAARVAWSLTLLTIALPNILRRWPEAGDPTRVEVRYFATLGISVFALILHTLIAWYAFEVTKPSQEFYEYPT